MQHSIPALNRIHTSFQKSTQDMPYLLALPFDDGSETRVTFAIESSGEICESHHAVLLEEECDHLECQLSLPPSMQQGGKPWWLQ